MCHLSQKLKTTFHGVDVIVSAESMMGVAIRDVDRRIAIALYARNTVLYKLFELGAVSLN